MRFNENNRLDHEEFAWVAEYCEKLPVELLKEELPRRIEQARESVVVLDLLAELFAGGDRWIRHCLKDATGFCLVGGLNEVRTGRASRDRAGVYLARAISRVRGTSMTIIEFNDSCYDYGEVREAISSAREWAQLAVDDYYAAHRRE
jgi:hypothetical protein